MFWHSLSALYFVGPSLLLIKWAVGFYPIVNIQKKDGISQIHKVAPVEIVFCGAPGCSQGTWIYIGGRSRLVEPRGAHEGGGVPGTLVAASFAS